MFDLGKTLGAEHPNSRQEGGMYALRVLANLNVINYADRNILNVVKAQVIASLHLSDLQAALPTTGINYI